MTRGPQETKKPAAKATAAGEGRPRATGKPRAGEPKPGETRAEAVAAYLRQHPDFFVGRAALFDSLRLPGVAADREGRVLDLRAAMLERLRGEVEEMTRLRDAMVAAGRANQQAQARAHQAVLALLQAETFEELIERATGDLATILDVDVASLGVEQRAEDLPPVRIGGVCQLERGTVDALIGPGRGVLLREAVEGDPLLFGAGAGLVRSDALVRLTISPATPPAILALGSRVEGHFEPSQGTELLIFLGAVLAECVRAWLDLPG